MLVLSLLILLNESSQTLLNSPELDVLRSRGTLRIGVDNGITGLYQAGEGLQSDMGLLLGQTVFGSDDCVSFVPIDRHTAQMAFEDGSIDLSLMSLAQIDEKGYLSGKQPFYWEDCVLLMRNSDLPLAELEIAVLNNTLSHELLIKYEEEVESDIIIVPCAAYYDMLVKLRANTVDALCMPYSVAQTYRDPAWVYHNERIGTLYYYAISTTDNKVLLDLIDELLLDWNADGTLLQMYQLNNLL